MRSPLLLLAGCFALGILAGRVGPPGFPTIAVSLATGAACLLAGAMALGVGRHRATCALALAGFIAAGAAATRLFERRFPPNHVSHLAALGVDLEDAVRLEGRLVSNPLRVSYGQQFDVEITRLESGAQVRSLKGKIRLRLQVPEDAESMGVAEALHLQYGDSIRALARLRRPRVYQNPGSFNFRRWMESIEDISYVGTIKSPHLVEKLADKRAPRLTSLLQRTRRRLLQSIDRLYPPWSAERRNGAVVKAVLLGDRSSLASDTIENFRRTGLYHLLVISGLHVGLLAMLVALVLRLLHRSETLRSSMVLLFLLGYASLVEQRAPTLRATLMITAYLLGRFLYREKSLLNAIGLAGLVLLVYRPAWLFESGFQLSFSAALLIAGLAVPILECTTEPYRRALERVSEIERDPSFPPRLAQFRLDVRALISGLTRRFTFFERHSALPGAAVTGPMRAALWAVNIVLFSAILQFGLLLPMAETFHRVTYAGIGLNALAIPLMTILLGVAVPTVLLGAIFPGLAVWPGKVLSLIMGGLFTLTDLPGLPAWLSFRVPEPPLWVSLGFAGSIVVAAWTLSRSRRAFWMAIMALGVCGMLISIHPFAPRLPRGELEATALDCGGGEATFLVLPDRTTLLVDGGGARLGAGDGGTSVGRRWDPGEDIVSPYLWRRGVKRIDVVILSHAHQDHLGGLAAVIRNFRVGEFWHGANPLTPDYQTLLEVVRRRRIPTRRLAAGDRIDLGESVVDVLWPPATRLLANSPSNDDSVVMRVSSRQGAVLLPGDISGDVERELVGSGAPLRSQVLKVAHHGAATSTSAEFLARVSPSVALVTAERDNPGNLPAPETLQRLRSAGARTFRPDIDGAVTVELKELTLAVRTYRSFAAD